MLYITFLCYQVLVFFKSEINNVQITFFPIFYVPKRLILYDENIKTYINNIDFFKSLSIFVYNWPIRWVSQFNFMKFLKSQKVLNVHPFPSEIARHLKNIIKKHT